MSASTARFAFPGRFRETAKPHVTGLLLAGGWLHGVAARIVPEWQAGGDLLPASLVSPLELMIVFIAGYGLSREPVAERLGLATFGFVALLLVPSALVTHAALMAFAILVAMRCHGRSRVSALLFAGLGACGLWGALYDRLAGGYPLQADAAVVQVLLGSVLPHVERVGNIVGVAGGHRIVILPGCSTLFALPLALLGLVALASRGPRLPPRLGRAVMALVGMYAVANWLRLTLLAISAEWYRVGHGPYGAMLFDALAVALPLAVAGRLHVEAEPACDETPRRAAPVGRLLPAVLIGLLTIGLGVKFARLGEPPAPSHEARAQAALVAFMAQEGWSVVARDGLTRGGATVVQSFGRAGCPGRLSVALATRAPEAETMLRQALGGNVRWLEAGTLYQEPPIGQQAWRAMLAAGVARLGGAADRVMPILAIRLPEVGAGACSGPPDQAWQRLVALP